MNYSSIDYLKKMLVQLFGSRLNLREMDVLNSYLEIAYMRGRLDELDNSKGRLAHPAQGEDYADFDARR